MLKTLGGLDSAERRKRQESRFAAKYSDRKLNCTFVSQGTKAGERALVSFSKAGVPFESLDELGMREKMIEQLKELGRSLGEGITNFKQSFKGEDDQEKKPD